MHWNCRILCTWLYITDLNSFNFNVIFGNFGLYWWVLEGRNMSTIEDGEALYQNWKNLSLIYVYTYMRRGAWRFLIFFRVWKNNFLVLHSCSYLLRGKYISDYYHTEQECDSLSFWLYEPEAEFHLFHSQKENFHCTFIFLWMWKESKTYFSWVSRIIFCLFIKCTIIEYLRNSRLRHRFSYC